MPIELRPEPGTPAGTTTLTPSADTVTTAGTMTYTVDGPGDADYFVDLLDAALQLGDIFLPNDNGVIAVVTGTWVAPPAAPERRSRAWLRADGDGALVVQITPGGALNSGTYAFRLFGMSPGAGSGIHLLTVTE